MSQKLFVNSIENYLKTKNKTNLKILKMSFEKLKKTNLDRDKRYLIIKKLGKNKKDLYNKMSLIGKISNLIPQNSKKDFIVEVKPKIKILKKIKNKIDIKKKLRYHQTNVGGSIHTDGPQLEKPPKYVVMGCVNNSDRGGHSIILDSKKLYQKINKDSKLKKSLNKKFYFERRGFSGKKILNKQIFTTSKKNYIFRYLRDYINAAYDIKNKKIAPIKLQLLNRIDQLMKNKNLHKRYKLMKGDIIILNNFRLAHGRTDFSLNKKNSQRNLLRMWLKK